MRSRYAFIYYMVLIFNIDDFDTNEVKLDTIDSELLSLALNFCNQGHKEMFTKPITIGKLNKNLKNID